MGCSINVARPNTLLPSRCIHMRRTNANMTDRCSPFCLRFERSHAICLLLLVCCWVQGTTLKTSVAESVPSQNSAASSSVTNATAMVESNPAPHFSVRAYAVEGSPLLPTNTVASIVSKYTGTNISLEEIVQAASDLQLEYHNQGYPAISIAFVPEQITDGIVTFNVAQTAIPQIVVAGERYMSLSNGVEIVSKPPAAAPFLPKSRLPPPPPMRRRRQSTSPQNQPLPQKCTKRSPPCIGR